jgi:NitT/TauT family transport system ATP-binding protein
MKSHQPTSEDSSIVVEKLSHSFDDVLVLDEMDCSFPKGSLIAILGPSGCGKTTFLKALAGLLKPTSGSIHLDGFQPIEARQHGSIGFAFQSPTLLPWRTSLQNVLLPLEILGRMHNLKELAFAKKLLTLVDLQNEANKLPSQLSGGMQQRVGLARSLATMPSFLFLDEPFGALDGLTRDRLNEKVRQLWQDFPLTIVFVTHSVEEAVFLADFVLIMSPRPSRIRHVERIELGTHREASVRMSDEFWTYRKHIIEITRELT